MAAAASCKVRTSGDVARQADYRNVIRKLFGIRVKTADLS